MDSEAIEAVAAAWSFDAPLTPGQSLIKSGLTSGSPNRQAFHGERDLRRAWHLERMLTLRRKCPLRYTPWADDRVVFIGAAGPDARRRGS
jgi:hypothetical protein